MESIKIRNGLSLRKLFIRLKETFKPHSWDPQASCFLWYLSKKIFDTIFQDECN